MFCVDLGAGRKKADDAIDYAAGVMFDRNVGDEVRAGDVIARIQVGRVEGDVSRFLSFVEIGERLLKSRPLVHEHLA